MNTLNVLTRDLDEYPYTNIYFYVSFFFRLWRLTKKNAHAMWKCLYNFAIKTIFWQKFLKIWMFLTICNDIVLLAKYFSAQHKNVCNHKKKDAFETWKLNFITKFIHTTHNLSVSILKTSRYLKMITQCLTCF